MATISKFEDAHRDECSRILYALPQWFGIEDANRAYIAAKGFEPLFESLTEWGSEDAALVLVEKLSG
jgi:hypothetical protein